jgi:RodZ C-terminal domain
VTPSNEGGVSTTTSPNGAPDLGERCGALERECEELRERVALLENPPKPPRRRARAIVADGLFVLLGGLVVAAIAGGVAIAAGVWKLDSEPSDAATQAAPPATVVEQEPSQDGPFAGGSVTTQAAPTETSASSDAAVTEGVVASAPVHFIASAVGGDCWLQVRRGDADGKVLWEGILLDGRSTEFDGKQFWIRMGDPTNLRLDVNGEPVLDLPTLAADMVITETGASVVPTS